jgi:hypothetical protein
MRHARHAPWRQDRPEGGSASLRTDPPQRGPPYPCVSRLLTDAGAHAMQMARKRKRTVSLLICVGRIMVGSAPHPTGQQQAAPQCASTTHRESAVARTCEEVVRGKR